MARNREDTIRILKHLGFEPSGHKSPEFSLRYWTFAFEHQRQFRTVCLRKGAKGQHQPKRLSDKLPEVQPAPRSEVHKGWYFRSEVAETGTLAADAGVLACLLVRLLNSADESKCTPRP